MSNDHRIALRGPSAGDDRVSGHVFRDLLDILVEGSEQAVRFKIDGRSTPKLPEHGGNDDHILSLLADFDVLALVLCLSRAAEEEFPHWPVFLWGAPHLGMEALVELISNATFAQDLLGGGQRDLRGLLLRFQKTVRRAAASQGYLAWHGFEDTPKIEEFLASSSR